VQNLATPEDWKEAAKYCEGINDEAPLIALEVIQSNLEIDKKDPPCFEEQN
jgi:hypothetical protein